MALFVGQLMVLAESWDSAIPVPEAQSPDQTLNPTLTAAAGRCGHTAVLGVEESEQDILRGEVSVSRLGGPVNDVGRGLGHSILCVGS